MSRIKSDGHLQPGMHPNRQQDYLPCWSKPFVTLPFSPSPGLNPPPRGGELPASVLDTVRMMEYRKNAHSVRDVKFYIIWMTEYRFKVLRGEVATRARDLLRQICQGGDVVIVQGSVSPDHIHMLVSVPPQLAPAKLVQYLKGRSSRMLQDEFPQLKKCYWGQHLWARGYFCASVGAVDEETIRRYIEIGSGTILGENFKITVPTEP